MTDRERFYVQFRPTDGAHATAWLLKDRLAKWYSVVSQHRSEKAAQDKADRLNSRGGGLVPAPVQGVSATAVVDGGDQAETDPNWAD